MQSGNLLELDIDFISNFHYQIHFSCPCLLLFLVTLHFTPTSPFPNPLFLQFLQFFTPTLAILAKFHTSDLQLAPAVPLSHLKFTSPSQPKATSTVSSHPDCQILSAMKFLPFTAPTPSRPPSVSELAGAHISTRLARSLRQEFDAHRSRTSDLRDRIRDAAAGRLMPRDIGYSGSIGWSLLVYDYHYQIPLPGSEK